MGGDLTFGNAGNIALLDSTSANSGTTIKFTESSTTGNRNNPIVI